MKGRYVLVILVTIILFSQSFAQEKPKENERVKFANEQLQKLQVQYQKIEDDYKKLTGEYHLALRDLQTQAQLWNNIINEEKKKEVKKEDQIK
ncbi:MAG: hypothetical protein FD143_3038 [Ignavibacteria bacterium]|nr:MAG: hypothetical protein FD143_3038 [Ignavibacteria bacterium]